MEKEVNAKIALIVMIGKVKRPHVNTWVDLLPKLN